MRHRFVRVEWLTWYRDETMCTMSEFRVYGSNMMNAMLVLIQSITHLQNTDFMRSDVTAGCEKRKRE